MGQYYFNRIILSSLLRYRRGPKSIHRGRNANWKAILICVPLRTLAQFGPWTRLRSWNLFISGTAATSILACLVLGVRMAALQLLVIYLTGPNLYSGTGKVFGFLCLLQTKLDLPASVTIFKFPLSSPDAYSASCLSGSIFFCYDSVQCVASSNHKGFKFSPPPSSVESDIVIPNISIPVKDCPENSRCWVSPFLRDPTSWISASSWFTKRQLSLWQ